MNYKTKAPNYERLDFPGLELDQDKISQAYDAAIEHATYLIAQLFGRVAVRGASHDLSYALSSVLAEFAERVAGEISSKYTTQVLDTARTSTSTMFEALAAGAIVAKRAHAAGADPAGVAHALATISACGGRGAPLAALAEDEAEING